MPSERGFVSLWRDIDKQPWYKNHKRTTLFVHLMIKASFQPCEVVYRGHAITLMPGQVAKTTTQLANETGLTKLDVQRGLAQFKKLGQITTKTDNKFTIISLSNWAKFNQKIDTVSDTANDTVNDTRKSASAVPFQADSDTVSDTANDTASDTQKNNVFKNNGLEEEKDDASPKAPLPTFSEDRENAFEHFWRTWSECKKLIGSKNTADKPAARKKFLTKVFTPGYVRKIGLEQFAIEIDALCDKAWEAHDEFRISREQRTSCAWFHIENMQPNKFLSGEHWRAGA